MISAAEAQEARSSLLPPLPFDLDDENGVHHNDNGVHMAGTTAATTTTTYATATAMQQLRQSFIKDIQEGRASVSTLQAFLKQQEATTSSSSSSSSTPIQQEQQLFYDPMDDVCPTLLHHAVATYSCSVSFSSFSSSSSSASLCATNLTKKNGITTTTNHNHTQLFDMMAYLIDLWPVACLVRSRFDGSLPIDLLTKTAAAAATTTTTTKQHKQFTLVLQEATTNAACALVQAVFHPSFCLSCHHHDDSTLPPTSSSSDAAGTTLLATSRTPPTTTAPAAREKAVATTATTTATTTDIIQSWIQDECLLLDSEWKATLRQQLNCFTTMGHATVQALVSHPLLQQQLLLLCSCSSSSSSSLPFSPSSVPFSLALSALSFHSSVPYSSSSFAPLVNGLYRMNRTGRYQGAFAAHPATSILSSRRQQQEHQQEQQQHDVETNLRVLEAAKENLDCLFIHLIDAPWLIFHLSTST